MSPKTPIPDAEQRLIDDLIAERAADPRNWVLLKHKPRPKKKSEHDGRPDACTLLGFGETKVGELLKSEQILSYKPDGALRISRNSILQWMIAQIKAGDLKPAKIDGRRARLARERAALVEKRNGGGAVT